LVLLSIVTLSVVNAAFFGCAPVPASGVGGYGAVACMSGFDDGVATLACTFSYANLTTDPILSHFHVGSAVANNGPVTFTFDVTGLVAASGTVYQKLTAANGFTQQGQTSFADQITACASGSTTTGCYFNLHTTGVGSGEIRCQLAPLTPTYAFSPPLVPAPGAVNTTTSFGIANVMQAAVSNSGLSAWGYQIDFQLESPITAAHIHQGTTLTDNSGLVKVGLDKGPSRLTGRFVGIALEGVSAAEQSASYWPVYAADFDTAIANHFCYVNVHSVANPGGEIRANISPNGASQIALSVFAAFFMIAAWTSL